MILEGKWRLCGNLQGSTLQSVEGGKNAERCKERLQQQIFMLCFYSEEIGVAEELLLIGN
eukprot:scaffold2462_cov120-Skeletonema_dohrnii-CCMP3373.AAC.2